VPQEFPEKWHPLKAFLQKVKLWEVGLDRSAVHPYDEEHEIRKMILNPRGMPFQPWDSYDFTVSLGDYSRTRSRADAFYCYWQIHYLDAVRRENLLAFRGNRQDAEFQECLRKAELPRRRLNADTSWYNTSSEDLAKIERLYDALSQYIVADKQEFHFAFKTGGVDEGGREVLRGESLKECLERCKGHALRISNTFNTAESQLYDFLRTLCTLYFDYVDNERQRMAEVVKKDIDYLIDFIEDVSSTPPAEISKKVGRIGGYPKDALGVIFPNVLEQAKDDAFYTIRSHLGDYQSVMPEEYRPSKEQLSELCDYCEDEFSLLFQTIQELNKDWHQRNAFTANNLFKHLRHLAILIEDLIRYIGDHSENTQMKEKFLNARARERTLDNLLKWMFYQARWWGAFKQREKKVAEIDFADVDEVISKILEEESFHKQKWMNFVIRNFLITIVVRNLSAHSVRHHEKLFRFYYVPVIDALIQTFVYVWMNAKEKKLL
jgi:hypothetical protein